MLPRIDNDAYECCYSIMHYRKYLQLLQSDEDIELTTDIKLEVLLGLGLALITVVMKETSDLKRTSLQVINAETTKTYEKSVNQNRSTSLRNLLRSRTGSIFSSGFSNMFPNAKEELAKNSQL